MSTRDLVFLSYAKEDLDQVRKLYTGLNKRKVNLWFDKNDLKKGKWKPQITKAISRSRYFVICLSNTALKKTSGDEPGFQDEELQIAWEFARELDEKTFTIVPVRLEDCGRGDRRLLGWQQYDLFQDWDSVLDKLAVNLGGFSLSDSKAIDERNEDEKMLESIMGKGTTFYYSGEYDRALAIFEAAVSIKPDYPEAWSNKGVALGNLGRHSEAIEAYNKAIKINPNSKKTWLNKGIALVHLNCYDKAIEAFNKAIEILFDFDESLHEQGFAHVNLDSNYEALSYKGIALNYLGQYDKALDAFNEAIDIKPYSHEAWSNKGVALGNLGRHDESLEANNKAIVIKPDYYEAWFNKGVALGNLGRKKEAQRAFEKANEIKYKKKQK